MTEEDNMSESANDANLQMATNEPAPVQPEPEVITPPVPEPTADPVVVEETPLPTPEATAGAATAQPDEPLNPEPEQVRSGAGPEPVPEPQPAPEPSPEPSIPTPQPSPQATAGAAEPIQTPELILEPELVISEPVSAPELQATVPQPSPEATAGNAVSLVSRARELLVKAREVIQFRKRKKLEKIMSLFLKQSSITNDGVQKLLYVSDATATRYLDQLEKEGRIKKESAGKYLSYSRM